MSNKGTYIEQWFKDGLKSFAERKVILRTMTSPLGEELFEMFEQVGNLFRTVLRRLYPVADMQVLNRYGQSEMCSLIHLQGERSEFFLPLLPRDYLMACIRTPLADRHNSDALPIRDAVNLYLSPAEAAAAQGILDLEQQSLEEQLATGCTGRVDHLVWEMEGVPWKLSPLPDQVSEFVQLFNGLMVSSKRVTNRRAHLFYDWNGPAMGVFGYITLEDSEVEPNEAEAFMAGDRLFEAVKKEVKRHVCAYDVLIERKRTMEALIAAWPEAKEYMDEKGKQLMEGSCPKLSVQEAEALVQQDLAAD